MNPIRQPIETRTQYFLIERNIVNDTAVTFKLQIKLL